MSDTQDTTMIPVEAVDLVAQLVQFNADSLAHTNNQLHEAALRDVIQHCDALIELEEILDLATVVDRKTEARLGDVWWKFRMAREGRASAVRMLTTMGVDVSEFEKVDNDGRICYS